MIITALCVSVGSVFQLCPLASPAFNNYQEDQKVDINNIELHRHLNVFAVDAPKM